MTLVLYHMNTGCYNSRHPELWSRWSNLRWRPGLLSNTDLCWIWTPWLSRKRHYRRWRRVDLTGCAPRRWHYLYGRWIRRLGMFWVGWKCLGSSTDYSWIKYNFTPTPSPTRNTFSGVLAFCKVVAAAMIFQSRREKWIVQFMRIEEKKDLSISCGWLEIFFIDRSLTNNRVWSITFRKICNWNLCI